MNIRDLKYLIALEELKHFGKAAEKCFVSQPALSMQIQKLEEILGIQIIERTNKSLLFTESGLAIVERAKEILNQVDEILEVAQQAQNPYSGELKVGIFPTLAPYLLPHIIPALTKKFPKLTLYLIEEKTNILLEQLKAGKLHVAILAAPIVEKNLTASILFDEEFLLAVPKDHKLANTKKITTDHLDNQKLLLLDEGHCLREQALSVCQTMNAGETQNFRATSLETLRHMIATGTGMTFMPKLSCHKHKNIVYIPFAEPKPKRTICAVWRSTTGKHQLLTELCGVIKKVYQASTD